MADKETRSITTPARVELRDGRRVISGYPIVYNKDSEDMGFIERIAPGAAKKALSRSDIRGLKNHDISLIFGRQGVNLEFKEDKDGLYYEATEIDTRTFKEVAEEVRLGLLTGQSFGFTILSDEWKGLDTDKPTRTITEIGQIYDVGPVTYPAYQDTSVALRSLEQAKAEVKEKPDSAFGEPLVCITLGWEEGENLFSLNEIDRAIEYIESLRPAASPSTAATGSADDVPTDDNSPDTAEDLMERIGRTLNKYEV